MSTNIELT